MLKNSSLIGFPLTCILFDFNPSFDVSKATETAFACGANNFETLPAIASHS